MKKNLLTILLSLNFILSIHAVRSASDVDLLHSIAAGLNNPPMVAGQPLTIREKLALTIMAATLVAISDYLKPKPIDHGQLHVSLAEVALIGYLKKVERQKTDAQKKPFVRRK